MDRAKAGVASGVINASRQVGGALGVAVLGAVVSVRVSDVWTHGEQFVPLVTGGQASKLPAPLQADATSAFVHGVQGAMLVGAVFAFAAAMTAFFGLRNVPIAQQQPAESADSPPVMIEA